MDERTLTEHLTILFQELKFEDTCIRISAVFEKGCSNFGWMGAHVDV